MNILYEGDFVFFLSDIFLIFSILILLCFSIYLSLSLHSLYISKVVIDLSLPILFIIFLMTFYLNLDDIYFFYSFKIDILIFYFKIFFILFLFFCLISSRNYFIIEKIYLYEYPVIVLLSIEGSFLLFSSYDLFVIYLALELQNFCFYIISSIKRYSSFSTEAGLKYFLLGAFSSSLFLYGISILYGLFGTLNINDIFFLINNFDINTPILYISLIFILSGIIFKLGGSPFHWWLPDVYEGSPMIVTMFFSILPKIVYTFLFIKLFLFIFSFDYFFFSWICFFVGMLSIIIGMLNAIYQYKIKRFLAYSAIANVGYIFLALSLCDFLGIYSSIYFIVCYLSSVLLIFIFLTNYRRNNFIEFSEMFDLSFLSGQNLMLCFIISLVFCSFGGIPPMIGFFGKFFIFISLSQHYNYIVMLFLLFLSVLSGFYYVRMIRFLFFSNVNENIRLNIFGLVDLLVIIFFLNVFFILFFDFFSENLFFMLINYLYL